VRLKHELEGFMNAWVSVVAEVRIALNSMALKLHVNYKQYILIIKSKPPCVQALSAISLATETVPSQDIPLHARPLIFHTSF